jgi:hypothetical protein
VVAALTRTTSSPPDSRTLLVLPAALLPSIVCARLQHSASGKGVSAGVRAHTRPCVGKGGQWVCGVLLTALGSSGWACSNPFHLRTRARR